LAPGEKALNEELPFAVVIKPVKFDPVNVFVIFIVL
jgi:hypothetical protein